MIKDTVGIAPSSVGENVEGCITKYLITKLLKQLGEVTMNTYRSV